MISKREEQRYKTKTGKHDNGEKIEKKRKENETSSVSFERKKKKRGGKVIFKEVKGKGKERQKKGRKPGDGIGEKKGRG